MKALGLLVIALPAVAEPRMVFIPEGSADSILLVGAETGETVRRIEGIEAVHGLSGAPGVPYLVAGSYAETPRDGIAAMAQPEGVSADDHAAHHKPAAKPLGPKDAGLSIVTILDASNGDILRRIEAPGAVHHTAVSPGGRFAVATHPAGDGISVIDLSTISVTGYVVTGAMPNYAVFGADPALVYISNTGNGTISEVDLTRGIVRRNMIVEGAPEHLAIDVGAGRLYIADADAGRVVELALADGTTLRTFDIGGEIHGIGLSDDGATLFVAGRGAGKLTAVDLALGETREAALAPEPYHLTVIPGTGTLFVSSRAEPKVWMIDAATLEERGVIPVEGEGHQMIALP
ncbi:YncE family protein [Defluviimonas salinarum]|uniref:YncE family protein n=1 Tax=Defluviimonas salinarum TaxID=2992147 RepID=A0ABT3J5E0_9RHOB|nr:YncE family protein [Defluviimonas salinarum]MCW3782877.1 YncE family protein [Defluviimonas salinarum]